jgi:hypothetical protein
LQPSGLLEAVNKTGSGRSLAFPPVDLRVALRSAWGCRTSVGAVVPSRSMPGIAGCSVVPALPQTHRPSIRRVRGLRHVHQLAPPRGCWAGGASKGFRQRLGTFRRYPQGSAVRDRCADWGARGMCRSVKDGSRRSLALRWGCACGSLWSAGQVRVTTANDCFELKRSGAATGLLGFDERCGRRTSLRGSGHHAARRCQAIVDKSKSWTTHPFSLERPSSRLRFTGT